MNETNEVSHILQASRVELGFTSARSFYLNLEKRCELNFNYQYYMKIESGKVLPSAEVIRVLSTLLTDVRSDELTLAYCRALFSNKKNLFAVKEVRKKELAPITHYTVERALVLTERQVAAICSSQINYYLFLLLTLARKALSKEEITQRFKSANLAAPLHELAAAKVIYEDNGMWQATSTEFKFPKISPSIKSLLEQTIPWDNEFESYFEFSPDYKKLLIRRISPRHARLIVNHCQLLTDLILSSEDTDASLNDDSIFFQLRFSKGRLPG